jgi:hypothetical protein
MNIKGAGGVEEESNNQNINLYSDPRKGTPDEP